MTTAAERNRDWPMVRALPGPAEEMVAFLRAGPAPYVVMIKNRAYVPLSEWLEEHVGPSMIEQLPAGRPLLEGEPRADYQWTDGTWIGVAWPTLVPEGRMYLFTNPDDAFAFKMRWA